MYKTDANLLIKILISTNLMTKLEQNTETGLLCMHVLVSCSQLAVLD